MSFERVHEIAKKNAHKTAAHGFFHRVVILRLDDPGILAANILCSVPSRKCQDQTFKPTHRLVLGLPVHPDAVHDELHIVGFGMTEAEGGEMASEPDNGAARRESPVLVHFVRLVLDEDNQFNGLGGSHNARHELLRGACKNQS